MSKRSSSSGEAALSCNPKASSSLHSSATRRRSVRQRRVQSIDLRLQVPDLVLVLILVVVSSELLEVVCVLLFFVRVAVCLVGGCEGARERGRREVARHHLLHYFLHRDTLLATEHDFQLLSSQAETTQTTIQSQY